MQLTVIGVGRLREKGFRMAADEYIKRLGRFARVQEIELADLPEPAGAISRAVEEQIMEKEGQRILERIRPGDYVVALCIDGKRWQSEALAAHIDALKTSGVSSLTFVLGGSLGLSPQVLARADERLSMSPMTFPHQLARVMLLEQLYRCEKINAHERYHK